MMTLSHSVGGRTEASPSDSEGFPHHLPEGMLMMGIRSLASRPSVCSAAVQLHECLPDCRHGSALTVPGEFLLSDVVPVTAAHTPSASWASL